MKYFGFVIAVAVAVALVVWAGRRRKRKFSPEKGRRQIERAIGKTNEKKGVYVFKDVSLADREKVRKADYILVDAYGVFVVDAEDCFGSIYGNVNTLEWTVVSPDGETKRKFFNPVRKNENFIRVLRVKLPGGIPVTPVVVFVGGRSIDVAREHIYTNKGFARFLKGRKRKALNRATVERIGAALNEALKKEEGLLE